MPSNEGLIWLIGVALLAAGLIFWMAAIFREELRKKRDLKQLEKDCPSEVQVLASYVDRLWGPPSGLSLARQLAIASNPMDAEDVTPANMVTADILSMLKELRGSGTQSDLLRPSAKQKRLIRMFAAKTRNVYITNMQPWQLEGWILDVNADALVGLRFLAKMGHGDRHTLRDSYIAFATLASEGSPETLATVHNRIRDDAMTEQERLEESVRRLEDLQGLCGEMIVDAHRRVLEVDADCSQEQLKANYRRLVSLWHPDKLQAMAPQLQELAEAKVVQLNEAYAALSGSSSAF